MAKRFIMTAFAQDRVGFVADLTQMIFESGCNLEETEMTQLEDEFVMMLLFTGEGDDLAERFSKECRRLEREKEITAFVRELSEEKEKPKKIYSSHTLFAEGVDQAGIVYKISDFLAKRSVNIARLISRKLLSPQTGTTIYTVEVEMEVPEGVALHELEHGILELGNEMHIDFNLNAK
jgi:glycine cleavage system transcriptional repressor